MSNSKSLNFICPETKTRCSLAQELVELRKEVGYLRDLVRIDALTSFYNFRYFKESLRIEMERTRRTGLATGLIMADLDHFKRINDTYGHEVGNLAIVHATALWRGQIRQLDIPCRYGGEEFAIIMPNTSFPMVIRAAERLRSILAANPLSAEGIKIALTASFGVDCFQFGESISDNDFISRADGYLLEAKQNGRNKVSYDEQRLNDRSTEISADERKLLFSRPTVEETTYPNRNKKHSKRDSKGPAQNVE